MALPTLGKRFYRQAGVRNLGQRFQVTLDGRPLKTPAKRVLDLPTAALARAIADEWNAQDERIEPRAMPLTRLAATAVDWVAEQSQAVVDEVVGFAQTDLVCHRAHGPPELAARQETMWQPLMDWVAGRYGARLSVTTGVMPVTQAAEALKALEAAVQALDTMSLAALRAATTASGSLVIALALVERRLDAEAAFAASELDETFQIEAWGEDPLKADRRAALKAEIAAAARFLALCRV